MTENISSGTFNPMGITELFVFRHGQTDWNRLGKLQGHTDIPLNSEGHLQAEKLKEVIEVHKPQVIVTSDLKRAIETSQIVSKNLKIPIIESVELRECFHGDAEGLERKRLAELFGQSSHDRWLSSDPVDHHFCFPNGETKAQHLNRLLGYIETFCIQNKHLNRIAVSTHGGSLHKLINYCEGAPKHESQPNCALHKFSFRHQDSKWLYVAKLN